MTKSELKIIKRENNTKRELNKECQIDYLDKNDLLREQILKFKISTLQEGQVFDNWLDLFDYLNLYYPAGGGKRITFQNRLKRWVNIQKSTGTKLIINEIYEEPIEWEDNRKNGNNSVYITLLSTILLWRLLQEDNYEIEVTYNQFWKMMGLRNSYYGNKDIQKMLPKVDKDMTSEFLEDFFKWTGSKNKSITDYTLDKLQDKGYLKYQKQLMIKEDNKLARKATHKEESKILSEETKIMKSMGYTSRKDLFMAGKTHELYNKVKKNVGVSYFETISIVMPDDEVLIMGIKENIEELNYFNSLLENDYKVSLNKEITDRDLLSAQKRQNNEMKRLKIAYDDYKANLALGVPENIESFISSKGYKVFIDESYVTKFEKANHYFSDLNITQEVEEVMEQVKEMIKEEKQKELNGQNSEKNDRENNG